MLCHRAHYVLVWPVSDHPKFAVHALLEYVSRVAILSLQGMHAVSAKAGG